MEWAATRAWLDEDLAMVIASRMSRVIAAEGRVIGLFDGSPLLAAVYECLADYQLDWTRVIGIQLRERCGPEGQAQRLLIDRLVSRVPMAEFHSLRGSAPNLAAVCANYADLLRRRPPDFALVALEEGGYPILLQSVSSHPKDVGPVCHQPPWIGLSFETLRDLPQCLLVGSRREIESLPPFGETVSTYALL